MFPCIRSIFSAYGPTEEIQIKIFDLFDNDDFGLESVDILVPSDSF